MPSATVATPDHHRWRAFALRLQSLGYQFDPGDFRLPECFAKLPTPNGKDGIAQNREYAAAADLAEMRFSQPRTTLLYAWRKALGSDFHDAPSLYDAIDHRVMRVVRENPPLFPLPAIRAQMILSLAPKQRELLEDGTVYHPQMMDDPLTAGLSVMTALEHLAAGAFNSVTRLQLCALQSQLNPHTPPQDRPLERYQQALKPGKPWPLQPGFSISAQEQAAAGRQLEAVAAEKMIKMLRNKQICTLLTDYAARDIKMLPDMRARIARQRLDRIGETMPLTRDRLHLLALKERPRDTPDAAKTNRAEAEPSSPPLGLASEAERDGLASEAVAHGPAAEKPAPASGPHIRAEGDGPENRRSAEQLRRLAEQNRRARRDARHLEQENTEAAHGNPGSDIDLDRLARYANLRGAKRNPDEGPLR